jgi:small nuclear ribonucleoprotein (snRNP)-like protein
MRSRRLIRDLERRRVLVTTTSRETFDGILLDADPGHLVMVDAVQLTDDGKSVAIDGQLWLPTDRVAYLQRPEV